MDHCKGNEREREEINKIDAYTGSYATCAYILSCVRVRADPIFIHLSLPQPEIAPNSCTWHRRLKMNALRERGLVNNNCKGRELWSAQCSRQDSNQI